MIRNDRNGVELYIVVVEVCRCRYSLIFSSAFVTVEDPSDDMIRLRDYVDTVNALKLLECFSCFEKVRSGFTKEMASEAKEKMKLGKKQTRKVYEIIRLHWTKKAGPLNDNNVEYKNYRVDVKKRLNIPYQVGTKVYRLWVGTFHSDGGQSRGPTRE